MIKKHRENIEIRIEINIMYPSENYITNYIKTKNGERCLMKEVSGIIYYQDRKKRNNATVRHLIDVLSFVKETRAFRLLVSFIYIGTRF